MNTAMEDTERRRDTRARISLPAHVVRRGGMEAIEMLDGVVCRFRAGEHEMA